VVGVTLTEGFLVHGSWASDITANQLSFYCYWIW